MNKTDVFGPLLATMGNIPNRPKVTNKNKPSWREEGQHGGQKEGVAGKQAKQELYQGRESVGSRIDLAPAMGETRGRGGGHYPCALPRRADFSSPTFS